MAQDRLKASGVILSVMPVGEADKRLVILTGELGKIHVFARGVKRPKNPFSAACEPFVFGTFEIYEGRTAYSLAGVRVQRYFRELKDDYEAVCFGSYFLELADYFGRENVEAADQVNLIWLSLLALENERFSNRLVRSVYELRTLVHNGEYPSFFSCAACGRNQELSYFSNRRNGCICADCAPQVPGVRPILPSALYACQFIVAAPLKSLYSFRVTPQVEENLSSILNAYLYQVVDRTLKTKAFLD